MNIYKCPHCQQVINPGKILASVTSSLKKNSSRINILKARVARHEKYVKSLENLQKQSIERIENL